MNLSSLFEMPWRGAPDPLRPLDFCIVERSARACQQFVGMAIEHECGRGGLSYDFLSQGRCFLSTQVLRQGDGLVAASCIERRQ
ncbi:hypothetical protein DBV14_14730 [Variovorax sp. KBW07]|uniref:hypothetical protein n=1 Tax=Variovorax sp. KBW07 TaxID=2153358 RepID=UPI000F58B7F4|nr:hypothetical protein [Variovorax sp. KBW07]RQO53285.1 hypothetical protein DBV14_14730 [Variovorax sp. KBW07]